MPPLEQFHPFPNLPAEIRLKIWKINLTQLRTIKITYNRTTSTFIPDSRPHPLLLHTCQESRLEAETTHAYTPLFKSKTDTSPHPRYYHISFPNDTIHCPASVLAYLGPVEIASIQKLILEVGDPAYFGHFHMETIVKMGSLRELELLISQEKELYSWDTRTHGERLRNDFEGERRVDLGWKCPRVRISNVASGKELCVFEGGPLVEGWVVGDEYPELD